MDTEQAGSASYPVKTIEYALKKLNDGDILYFKGNYKAEKNLQSNSNKTIYITGDTVDFSSLGSLEIRNNTVFTGNLTIKLPENLIANGHSLRIDESVTVVPHPEKGTTVFGGSSVNSVESTNLTLLSGTFYEIFGGGVNGGEVIGNTNVTISGNVNANAIYGGGKRSTVKGNTFLYLGGNINKSLNISDHDEAGKAMAYGGAYEGTVSGTANIEIGQNAKVGIIYGAGNGQSSVVDKSVVVFNSGNVMGVYGGSKEGKCNSTSVTMNGGYVEQIFGGSNSAPITGNTDVRVLGGTVKRRVYGGCYNDYGLSWKSSYFVTGNTNVVFSCNADFPRNHTSGDNALCAISRYNENKSAENATLILSDYKDAYKNKIGSSYFTFTNGAYDRVFYVNSGIEAYSNGGVIYLKALKAGTISIKSGDSTENVAVSASETITRNLSNFNSKEITVTLS